MLALSYPTPVDPQSGSVEFVTTVVAWSDTMKSLWDETLRTEIADRVRRLTPHSPREWGRMNPHQMLCHTADQLRMAVGDITTGQARGPLAFAPVRFLVIHVLPWPKGKARLLGLIERFGRTPPDEFAPTNPVFGRVSPTDWAVLSYRHLDHHLRQFSV